MVLNTASVTLITTVFIASAVEAVEAFTIVLAMGVTRSWRAALIGTLTALVALSGLTAGVGVALTHFLSPVLLQFIIGALLLVFGLQWLRKAILRSSGLKAIHDEEKAFREEQEAARQASHEMHLGLDWFAFVVSFKGVLLEGLEVVFIVITFGLKAQNETPGAMVYASMGALGAVVLVTIMGAIVRHPLSAVPENTMKYAVGLLLSTFGLFWSVEGLGSFGAVRPGMQPHGIGWPGGEWALPGVLAMWLVVSQVMVAGLRLATARRTLKAVSEKHEAYSEAGGGS